MTRSIGVILRRHAKFFLLMLLVAIIFPGISAAQMFSYGGTERRSVQSLSFLTYFIDFEYNGSGDPNSRLDFSEPAYGVTYNRPGFSAAVVWGSSEREPGTAAGNLNIVDASVTFWGNIIRSRSGSEMQFGVPIVIYSGYRSVDPSLSASPNDAFSYSVLGIGTGATFSTQIGSKLWIDLRAWPVIAMSFRSFQGFSGSSWLVDSDAQINIVDFLGTFGLNFGYGYQWQVWNNDESNLVTGPIGREQFDYKSGQHMLRVGINW